MGTFKAAEKRQTEEEACGESGEVTFVFPLFTAGLRNARCGLLTGTMLAQ